MDGDNILKFPPPKKGVNSRTADIAILAEDISVLLQGECGNLDLGELLMLLEAASGKLYEMGAMLVEDSRDEERLKIHFSSIRILIAAARRRLDEIRRVDID
ncbi:MAG: hypothetical protein PS018_07355 [bacterium]|nr:hypothetical protein [bacterium]